jgi:protein-S-isoprenylcysteine O-methyltransferase Ste14
LTPEIAIDALWIAWLLSWALARFWANRTVTRDTIAAELLFRVVLYAGLILLFAFPRNHRFYAQTQLWRSGDALNWIWVALTAAGLSIAWWARIHLGRLWSDLVVKKSGHYVVDTGPYRLVRHPIYSGLIFAALATAIQKGTSFAILGVALVTVAFMTKARREERFLRAELGEDAYNTYARKTPMLAPSIRPRRGARS